jgi:hypothetical protein
MKAVWWGVIALGVLALAAVWGLWSTWCLDSDRVGYCESEPTVGWQGAAIVTVLAIATIIVAASKLRNRKDRLPTWTAH